MKTFGDSLEFISQINLDNGYVNKSLGVCSHLMQIWVDDSINDRKEINSLDIEWVYFLNEKNEDSIGIGCWLENGRLYDYDGVFELPRQAVKLLRKNGFVVPREFEH